MISVPQMVMIGGNSRNSGKTTMACSIIEKLAQLHEVIGLKVTNVRKGENDLHGTHQQEMATNYTVFEELNPDSHKDTSKMLKAGAAHVYYICAAENIVEQAVLHFLSKYINKQVIVCESRSLRGIITPGLFLLMMRLPAQGKEKDISEYFTKADKVFNFGGDFGAISKFAESLQFGNTKFVWS